MKKLSRRDALTSGAAVAVAATLGFPTMAKATTTQPDDSAILAMSRKLGAAKAVEKVACDAYSDVEGAAFDEIGPQPQHPHYHYNKETMRWEYLTPEAPANWNEAVRELVAKYEAEAGPQEKAEVEEYEKACAVYKRARKAAMRKHKVKAADRRAKRTCDYSDAVERKLLTIPAAGFAGLLVKARIAADWMNVVTGEENGDNGCRAVRAMLADLERLAGAA